MRTQITAEYAIGELKKAAGKDKCDGTCDELPPHLKCDECLAKEALNEIGRIALDYYYTIHPRVK